MRRIGIDGIGKAAAVLGFIHDLPDIINAIGILSIDSDCAYKFRLVGKGQGPSFIIIGKDVASISVEYAFRIIEDLQRLLLAALPGEPSGFLHKTHQTIYLLPAEGGRYIGEIISGSQV